MARPSPSLNRRGTSSLPVSTASRRSTSPSTARNTVQTVSALSNGNRQIDATVTPYATMPDGPHVVVAQVTASPGPVEDQHLQHQHAGSPYGAASATGA